MTQCEIEYRKLMHVDYMWAAMHFQNNCKFQHHPLLLVCAKAFLPTTFQQQNVELKISRALSALKFPNIEFYNHW